MNDPILTCQDLFKKVNQSDNHKYEIISDFGNSSVTSEEKLNFTYFRIFTPVKPESGRKLNAIYGGAFNPYKDTLMDYPTIIQFKLEKIGKETWDHYNRLISLHVSECPLDCWHCYIENCLKTKCDRCSIFEFCKSGYLEKIKISYGYKSADEILTDFLKQREIDKDKGKFSNVLRITGGEPLLVPNLLSELLNLLRDKKLDKEIFIWTETNLIPLIIEDQSKEPLISDKLLTELSNFNNFCIHPCFHGISKDNFKENTGVELNIDLLINALKRLIEFGIDVYPTFGSNVSNPDHIDEFYSKISALDPLLPLRFNLIEFDLNYKPIGYRREKDPTFNEKHKKVYDRFLVLQKWSDLLKKNTRYYNYGDIPRHLVPLKKNPI